MIVEATIGFGFLLIAFLGILPCLGILNCFLAITSAQQRERNNHDSKAKKKLDTSKSRMPQEAYRNIPTFSVQFPEIHDSRRSKYPIGQMSFDIQVAYNNCIQSFLQLAIQKTIEGSEKCSASSPTTSSSSGIISNKGYHTTTSGIVKAEDFRIIIQSDAEQGGNSGTISSVITTIHEPKASWALTCGDIETFHVTFVIRIAGRYCIESWYKDDRIDKTFVSFKAGPIDPRNCRVVNINVKESPLQLTVETYDQYNNKREEGGDHTWFTLINHNNNNSNNNVPLSSSVNNNALSSSSNIISSSLHLQNILLENVVTLDNGNGAYVFYFNLNRQGLYQINVKCKDHLVLTTPLWIPKLSSEDSQRLDGFVKEKSASFTGLRIDGVSDCTLDITPSVCVFFFPFIPIFLFKQTW